MRYYEYYDTLIEGTKLIYHNLPLFAEANI